MMKILFLAAISTAPFYYAQTYAVSAIPEHLKKNANVVIRKEDQVIEINKIDDIQYKKTSVITVLNNDGVSYSIPRIGYSKGGNISGIKVIIYDEKGVKVKTYSKSDFVDIAANPQGSFYSDNRMLILPYNYSQFPYTLEFTYELKDETTVFIPDFIPFYTYNISLQESKLNVINKSNINLRSKVYDSQFSYGQVEVKTDKIASSYFFKDIPAIDNGKMVPSPQTILPKVSFSLDQFNLVGKRGSITSWQDFGKWYYENLLYPVSISTPNIKSEIASLNLTGTIEEKVKRIYQYMQSKTRYVFVALGIGGWQPMLPDEVQKKGYGDCKGLTNYMKILLDEAGIQSNYCIINSDYSPVSFDKDFPKMSGNHVILMIPTEKGNIWLENTSQEIAFNHLSFSTTDRNTLAVKSDGIEIIQTPSYTAEQSGDNQTVEIQLTAGSSVSGKARFSYRGSQYDYHLMYVMLSEKERKDRLVKKLSTLDFENLDITKITNDKDKAMIDLDIDFKAANYTKMLGNDYVFRAVPLYDDIFHTDEKDRALPFENKFSFQDNYTIDYKLPSGYYIKAIPEDVTLNSEFGIYSIAFSKIADKLIVKRTLKIIKGIYPKDKYKDYINFRKKIRNADNAKVLMSIRENI
ncbi:DUF3857 domain-containing protein [Chryseobacterium indologenes]|uniref:DUF3857 domain-containing protein n=3 Tax=Chryseobacterium indologenes TaxID=253 RepID=A0AAD1DXI7_CHRID|nr:MULTISPECIES: DUF3857 domain-containing protein [Chryseobacterium]ASE60418.1 DUF3857 domain-containing protein [Chryseobacterium indologenes]AZB20324.1 DUF3857 domain-containing protein [Chryseobacterium indologenes]